MACWNVRDHGARGDGAAKDTAAIQAAIDACAEAGGGVVLAPAGRYLTGTLWLKSRVNLHLNPGAVIAGSPDRADYNADDAFPENQAFSRENVSAAHLIIAYKAEEVSISGQGAIDGASSSFFDPLPPDKLSPSWRSKTCNFPIRAWRPGQMVFFCRCRRVSVTGVSLLNAPYWTCFLLGCEDVDIRGLTITNPPQTANGDGIDVDCCRNVTISDCRIAVGDDCITLRGNDRRLPAPMPCENVAVTNCVLSSPCNAIRVGVGDGEVRNCALSNIVISDTRTAICLVSRYSASADHGVRIHDIRFSNFVVDAVAPLHMTSGVDAQPPATIENISFDGFNVRATAGAYAGGAPATPLRSVAFRHWDLRLDGGTDNEEYAAAVPMPYPLHTASGLFGRPALPCALFVGSAEDVLVEGLRVYWGQTLSRVWRDAFMARDSRGLVLRACSLPPPRAGGAACRLQRCRDVDLVSRQPFGQMAGLVVEEEAENAARVRE